jgi:competence ComEA-like helix-hairpin-helix protein
MRHRPTDPQHPTVPRHGVAGHSSFDPSGKTGGKVWTSAGVVLLALFLSAFPLAAQGSADTERGADPGDGGAAKAAHVVNINTADASQLALLPRVGPALSQRILDFRKENGEFEAPEELILVRGIGEKTFELLEPYVVVKGETTLTEKVRGVRSASAGGR